MARLTITHPEFGTWTQAPVNPLRRIIPNGLAITTQGANRHTGQPVNAYGLTFEAWLVQQAILHQFPDSPTKKNYAVDRNQRGTGNLSDHAKGQAVDIITRKWDGNLDISPGDQRWGTALFDWLVAEGQAKRLPLAYVLFNGRIARDTEGWRVRAVNGGDPHRDHLHTSVRVTDRRAKPTPPREARRTLRLRRPRMKGADVELVQRTIGTPVGTYGPITVRAVKDWQRARGLVVDGVVGPQTWARLDEVTAP